jgi:hypothetical protein
MFSSHVIDGDISSTFRNPSITSIKVMATTAEIFDDNIEDVSEKSTKVLSVRSRLIFKYCGLSLLDIFFICIKCKSIKILINFYNHNIKMEKTKKSAPKEKKTIQKFVLDCSKPVEDKVFSTNAFAEFLKERIKVNDKTGNLGSEISVVSDAKNVTVNASTP